MSLITKAVRGTTDVLPRDSFKNKYIEDALSEIAEKFGFRLIRTPVFEHTELCSRSTGEETDIVQKEMYTFNDKGGRSLTLRPEGTAGVARAFLEHGLFNEALPQKYYYISPCYRYEKPQAGRFREFYQFGVESFGSPYPDADVEIIMTALHFFEFLCAENIRLEVNSIGCPECRKTYHDALYGYFDKNSAKLCATCLDRLDRNPMRILDCKNPECGDLCRGAPVVLDYICGGCREHFEGVLEGLENLGADFTVNPKIVRGLDYYTRTVFEFISGELGAQAVVCGGGRYDRLIEELGGSPMPACGFGLGLARLQMILDAQNAPMPDPPVTSLFIISADGEGFSLAPEMCDELRSMGVSAEYDICRRSVKAQMKYADKINADYTAVVGGKEIRSRIINVKNMGSGKQYEMELETFSDEFGTLVVRDTMQMLEDSIAKEEFPANLTLLDGGKGKKDK